MIWVKELQTEEQEAQREEQSWHDQEKEKCTLCGEE